MTNTEPTPIQHSIHLTEIAPDTFVDANGHQLTPNEVRNIVTPHDFAVANELFGLKIARPWRRGAAMGIDAVLIAILAGGGGLTFFTPVYLYLVWRCHQLQTIKRRNILLGILPLVFIFAYTQTNETEQGTEIDLPNALELSSAALKINSENCDVICADAQADKLILTLLNNNFTDVKAEESLQGLLSDSALSTEQQQQKLATLKQRRENLSAARQLLNEQTEPDTIQTAADAKQSWWQDLQQSDHSVVKWIEGILADLGISFGWAIAYFTMFISWNNGQTPGKRMLSIKVVQLNNKPISLWGAFGRQGGYSAGFATGLLGFAQIYWDPNRQAVQDKLADTLVLKV